MPSNAEFEDLVNLHYPPLYRFAFSLTHREGDACDLTQQTFYIWARKGHQLKDPTKVKSWLFTTLHREFLQQQRRSTRYTELDLEEVEHELPTVSPTTPQHFDRAAVLDALSRVDHVFQAPIALFYLEDYSYLEIAAALEIPLGTVKSRISRGMEQLQALLREAESVLARKDGDD
jgi:RNA polymerase sigma-70 factor, ECF subfamily